MSPKENSSTQNSIHQILETKKHKQPKIKNTNLDERKKTSPTLQPCSSSTILSTKVLRELKPHHVAKWKGQYVAQNGGVYSGFKHAFDV